MDVICKSNNTSGWIGEFNSLYPTSVCDATNPKIEIGYEMSACTAGKDDSLHSICFDAVNLQGCSEFEKHKIYGDNQPSLIYIEIAKYLEEEYKCAGLCNVCPHFMYTNCNEGTVKEGCDDILLDLIKCKYENKK